MVFACHGAFKDFLNVSHIRKHRLVENILFLIKNVLLYIQDLTVNIQVLLDLLSLGHIKNRQEIVNHKHGIGVIDIYTPTVQSFLHYPQCVLVSIGTI